MQIKVGHKIGLGRASAAASPRHCLQRLTDIRQVGRAALESSKGPEPVHQRNLTMMTWYSLRSRKRRYRAAPGLGTSDSANVLAPSNACSWAMASPAVSGRVAASRSSARKRYSSRLVVISLHRLAAFEAPRAKLEVDYNSWVRGRSAYRSPSIGSRRSLVTHSTLRFDPRPGLVGHLLQPVPNRHHGRLSDGGASRLVDDRTVDLRRSLLLVHEDVDTMSAMQR